MRRTGSRDPRESREASATSPVSIAVNTFSISLGSRRNQRPAHQKIRSITTVSPTIDTIRIGHMIGPPLRKLSMRKLPVNMPVAFISGAGDAAGEAVVAGDALSVAETVVPGAGEAPTGPNGDVPAAGGGIGAAGFGGAPGICGAAVAGAFGGGGGGTGRF